MQTQLFHPLCLCLQNISGFMHLAGLVQIMSYIELKNVNKVIKGRQILKNINLSIEKGTITGLIGINGSGKTMLLRAISGLIRVDGEIKINGKKLENGTFPEDIGVLIEMPGFLPEFTGKKNLELLAMIQDNVSKEAIEEALIAVGLNPNDRRNYRKYSLGMRERLGIAQAIMNKPKLILLDEPTNGIDADGIENLKQLILKLKEEGLTLVIASHDMQFLDMLDAQKYEIKEGELCEYID